MFTIWNPDELNGRERWQEVLGLYPRRNATDESACEWEEMVHPEDRGQTLAQLDDAIVSNRRYHVEYRFRRKDGVYILVNEHGSFLPGRASGSVQMLLGTIKRHHRTEKQRGSKSGTGAAAVSGSRRDPGAETWMIESFTGMKAPSVSMGGPPRKRLVATCRINSSGMNPPKQPNPNGPCCITTNGILNWSKPPRAATRFLWKAT